MKYCEKCGSVLEDGVGFCPNCGATVAEEVSQPVAEQPVYEQPPVAEQPAYQAPVAEQPAYQQPAYQPPVNQYAAPQSQASKDASTVKTLGIVALIASLIFPFELIGLVCGIIGIVKAKPFKNGKEFTDETAAKGYKLSLAGVIIAAVAAVLGILGLIGAMILPFLFDMY